MLKESGVVIISIDDGEHARLKLLLDRVFGAENFAANVIWQGSGRNDSRFTSAGVDYMLMYAKDKARLITNDVRWMENKPGVREVSTAVERVWIESEQNSDLATTKLKEWWRNAPEDVAKGLGGSRGYKEIDQSGRAFARGDLRSPNPRENLKYELPHPVTGLPVRMHPNGWVYSPDTMQQKIQQGRILFGEDESVSPRYKRFLDELEFQPIRPTFEQDRAAAGLQLNKLMGSNIFEYPKDTKVLSKWILAVTPTNNDALVLDFFAGSGSTGHAVMDLNLLDGGSRRCILVQLGEPVGVDEYKTIADITRERLRRAARRIAANHERAADIDLGFASYRLASSNIQPWDGSVDRLDLLSAAENLVEDRTTDDLLVEMMLRLGVELTAPVQRREVAGSTLYSVGGTLYAYFGVDVTTERSDDIARALVAWRDENQVDSDVTVVVRDTGFVDSSAKLNLAAALSQAGITTLRSI